MKKNIFLIASFLLMGFINSSSAYANSGQIGELRIKGRLVADPCVIRPGDEEILVDFGTIVDKYLYLNKRSHIESFDIDIHLEDCDPDIAESLTVTFGSTNLNTKLPGLLALDSGSVATNIGIAILDSNANLIKINTPIPMTQLADSNNVLHLKSYVEAEPDAIQSRNIGLGTFTATATFTLLYD